MATTCSIVTLCALLLGLIVKVYSGPCDDYSELNDSWRNVNKYIGGNHCDHPYKGEPSTGLTAGWYRFTGLAGDRMATASPSTWTCSTAGRVWLNSSHPNIADGVVTRQACTNSGYTDCSYSWDIQVAACSGGFYVYYLPQTLHCNLAYCGDVRLAIKNSRCYMSRASKDYESAEQQCAAMGGTLALIKDEGTQDFVADLVREHSNVNYWVGIKELDATFQYSDLSTVQDQQLWAPDQPSPLCVYMDSGAGYKFSVADCSEIHGFVCQSEIVTPQNFYCSNGGIATSCFNETHNMCTCQPGFTGQRCRIDIDECESSPCVNGGTCLDRHNSYSCTCPQGFNGDRCENDIDLCSPNPCPFNWNCADNGGHLTCGLKADLRGSYQSLPRCSASSCPMGMTCRDDGPGLYSCMP